MIGKIKRLNEKGFGFITLDNGQGNDLFFHANDCTDRNFKDLHEGDMVTFEMGTSPKGPKATDVRLASGSDAGSDNGMNAGSMQDSEE